MTKIQSCLVRAAAGSAVLTAALPAVARAEEQNTGLTLLLPNMAEFIPACIAFIIIYLIMSKLAWPSVLKMMEDRENKIAGDLKAAEEARTKAETEAKNVDLAIDEAQRQAADIIAQAKRKAQEERVAILAAAQKDAAATIARGKDVVETERKRAMEDLSRSVVDLSVEIAGKIIGNDLSDDEHCALAAKYLQEVGDSDAS